MTHMILQLDQAHDAADVLRIGTLAIYEQLCRLCGSLFSFVWSLLPSINLVGLGSSFETTFGRVNIVKMVKLGLAHFLTLASIYSSTSEFVKAQSCPDYTTFSMVHATLPSLSDFSFS